MRLRVKTTKLKRKTRRTKKNRLLLKANCVKVIKSTSSKQKSSN